MKFLLLVLIERKIGEGQHEDSQSSSRDYHRRW